MGFFSLWDSSAFSVLEACWVTSWPVSQCRHWQAELAPCGVSSGQISLLCHLNANHCLRYSGRFRKSPEVEILDFSKHWCPKLNPFPRSSCGAVALFCFFQSFGALEELVNPRQLWRMLGIFSYSAKLVFPF